MTVAPLLSVFTKIILIVIIILGGTMRPKAIEVKPIDNYCLVVTFDNGEIKIYDVKPLIKGNWYGELRDYEIFNTVHIAGLSVEWANGQDVCPDDLYYSSVTM